MTNQILEIMSVNDLLGRFDNDIRYGCHSAEAEARRSFAGQELRKRGEEGVRAVAGRLQEMPQPSENALEARVREGFAILFSWINPDAETCKNCGSPLVQGECYNCGRARLYGG